MLDLFYTGTVAIRRSTEIVDEILAGKSETTIGRIFSGVSSLPGFGNGVSTLVVPPVGVLQSGRYSPGLAAILNFRRYRISGKCLKKDKFDCLTMSNSTFYVPSEPSPELLPCQRFHSRFPSYF